MAELTRRRFRLRLRNWLWLGIALAPTLFSLAIPTIVLWRAGELSPIPVGDSQLVGYAYAGGSSGPHVFARSPSNIAVVGTSRALQFRRQFFRPEAHFVNAGQSIASLEELLPFLEAAPPDQLPKVMIVILDQYFFNEEWSANHRGAYRPPSKPPSIFSRFTGSLTLIERSWRNVWTDFYTKSISLETISRDHYGKIALVGLTARKYLGGKRDDGSYRYGRRISSPNDPELEDFQFHNTFERIRKGRRRFEYGTELAPHSLVLLDHFLTRARELGIEIVGVLPPYANVVWDRMMNMGDKYEYLRILPAAVGTAFERHGMKLYDFSALRNVGATDDEALDGFHAGEKAMARATVIMARDHPPLGHYVDADKLERALQAAPDPLEVFPLEP